MPLTAKSLDLSVGLLSDERTHPEKSGRAAARNEADWIRSPFLPYAAPEAIRPRARALEQAADLYALGAVGYFLLAGRKVFEGKTAVELSAVAGA